MKKRWAFYFLKISIACIILFILIHRVQFEQIYLAFINPNRPVFIFLAIVLLMPNLFIQWYRWFFLLKLVNPQITVLESFSSYFGGFTIGMITPGRIGEVSRGLFLKDIDKLKAVGMVFIDKLYSVAIIFIGGVWGIAILLSHLSGWVSFIVWPIFTMSLLITSLILIFITRPHGLKSILYHLSLMLPYRDKTRRFIRCFDPFGKRESHILFMLSFLMYFIYILQFCFLALAFQNLPFVALFSSTTSTLFAKTLLPFSLADLGIREGASIYFFSQFQVEKVTAFDSSILLFAINILIPTFIGFFFLLKISCEEKNKVKSA
ncbi:flippase-like domain-containing protein [bacterium]|nr:flippase-like domain-containing protein [bacterium]